MTKFRLSNHKLMIHDFEISRFQDFKISLPINSPIKGFVVAFTKIINKSNNNNNSNHNMDKIPINNKQ